MVHIQPADSYEKMLRIDNNCHEPDGLLGRAGYVPSVLGTLQRTCCEGLQHIGKPML